MGFNDMTKRYSVRSETGRRSWFYEGELRRHVPCPAVAAAPAPVPAPARAPRQPLNDLAAAASSLRSLVTGPSPQHRLLRGFATTIAELFDLAKVLTEKELHVEAGVAGRGAVVLQEVAAKYQQEKAR
jgi:hypothetical protein